MNNPKTTLLLEVAEAIQEIARILKCYEVDRDLKNFYSSLKGWCLVVARVVRDHNDAQTSVAHQPLDRFQSLIVMDALPDFSTSQTPTSYFHLRTIKDQWSQLMNQSDVDKLRFIQRYFDFGALPEQRDELLDFLETWVDGF